MQVRHLRKVIAHDARGVIRRVTVSPVTAWNSAGYQLLRLLSKSVLNASQNAPGGTGFGMVNPCGECGRQRWWPISCTTRTSGLAPAKFVSTKYFARLALQPRQYAKLEALHVRPRRQSHN